MRFLLVSFPFENIISKFARISLNEFMQSQQELIVSTAARLFEQYGIRSVSIDDVCSELRISKKTLYTYFSQKEDLVEAVLNFQYSVRNEKYARMFRNKNAIDSLILIVKEIKKNSENELPAMCYDLEKYYPRIYERIEFQKRENIRAGFEQNLRQGIAEGYYREDIDVELISYFHALQIKSGFMQMMQDARKFSKKRLLDFFVDLIIHLIANEKGLEYLNENYYKSE